MRASVLFILLVFATAFADVLEFDVGWKYGEMIYNKCKPRETKKFKGMCAKLQELMEDMFDSDGQTIYAAFPKNAFSDAAKIVATKPEFAKAGEIMVDGILDWLFSHPSPPEWMPLRSEVFQRFFKWYVEVLKEVDTPGSGQPIQAFPEMMFPNGIPTPPKRP